MAAGRAIAAATTETERSHARELAWIAQTNLTVQFTRDADGTLRLTTTRVPYNQQHWNPFVERSDRLQTVEARFRFIDCDRGKLQLRFETPSGLLTLDMPDPSHVQIRNGPSEFNCGEQQPPAEVSVEYAAQSRAAGTDGVLRGLEFHTVAKRVGQ
jgi:hypothetical protein